MLDEQRLGQLFDEAVRSSRAVGAQLSIIRADSQVHFAAGQANAARGVAMTPDTLMQIGSITKLFNAIVVMSLVEERKLELDVPIAAYIPSCAVACRESSRALTLRHLLSMSSGLDNGAYVYHGSGDDALGRYVEALTSLPQHFAPGKYFGYSNAGICIAGYIASRVTGQSWEALLRERVLRPARLDHAVMSEKELTGHIVAAGHELSSHGGQPQIIEPQFDALRARAPSGPSLAMSARDLARFGAIFLGGGKVDSHSRVLAEASIELMLRPQISVPTRKYGTAWCLGPCTGRWAGHPVWGHGGTSATATSLLYWLPEQHGVIAFMVNTHAAMGEFSRRVLDEIAREAFGFSKPPLDAPEGNLEPLDPRRYVGRYEELGVVLDVILERGALKANWQPRPIANERAVARTEQSATLQPLGSNRFLVVPDDGIDKHRGLYDVAFFGDDGHGRAAHALNLVFPMSRVGIEAVD